jgi:hypothetical protein
MVEWFQELLCPYCDRNQDADYWEPEKVIIHRCEHCGRKFIIHTLATIVFSTEKFGSREEEEDE